MAKSYYGNCGFCKYCKLESGHTFWGSTTFDCVRRKQKVKATDKMCERFEPDNTKSNEIIAKYDK